MKEKYFNINDSGYSVRCKLYTDEKQPVKSLVVAFHGFGGHKDNRAVYHFAEKALSRYPHTAVLCFDLPCHGEDGQKKISLQMCSAYISSVLKEAKRRFPEAVLFAYATSFGAYLCLKEIHEHENPFRKTVLRCPAIRMYDALQNTILGDLEKEKLQKGKDVLAGFDRKVKISPAFLEEIRAFDLTRCDFIDEADALLILHGTKDEIIPPDTVREFAEDNVIEYIPMENADHRFSDPQIMNLVIAEMLKFYFEK